MSEMIESLIEKEQAMFKENPNGIESIDNSTSDKTGTVEGNSDTTAVKETSGTSVAVAETTSEPSSVKREEIPESSSGIEWKVKEIGSAVGEEISETKSTLQEKTPQVDCIVQDNISESISDIECKTAELASTARGNATEVSAALQEKLSKSRDSFQARMSKSRDAFEEKLSNLLSEVKGISESDADIQEKILKIRSAFERSRSIYQEARIIGEKSSVEKATDAGESETSDVKQEPEALIDKPDASTTLRLQKKFSEYIGEMEAECYFEAIPLLQEIRERKRNVMKVIVIGNSGVGKTSIIQRYVNNQFRPMCKATIGVDYFCKNVKTRYGTVELRIHDIAGQDRSTSVTRTLYRKSKGAMVCYDVTNEASFKAVEKWLDTISHICLADGSPIPRILVGNKCDARKSESSDSNKEPYAVEKSFGAWLQISAKNDINIESAFESLVHLMIAKEHSLSLLGSEETQNTLKLASRRGRTACVNKCS